ncbi:translocation and assembly module lipoprotein TamL [Mesonia aestuariivivens]|uniref:Outer membrane protein assembly factor n=1 Tax=Mesonia aestuariivivens TaxID=2796128 RepID=A0ABS6VZD9_9FLAO|nr:BamA/TamA family outer membrane protein [Mesonia aestuariivivens]MBW2960957.1 outer membrane protein assembly factor [Mesonia aestuariivivens]
MKPFTTKISFILFTLLIISCNAVKKVPDDEHLLTDNKIFVDSIEINKRQIYDQLYQEPNVKLPLLGLPLKLLIYNAANSNPDTTFYDWLHRKPKREKRLINWLSKKQVEKVGQSYVGFHEFLQETGEAPVILNKEKTERSASRLEAWYWNHGWFNAKADYKIIKKKNKRAKVNYFITPNQAYILDSISRRIASPQADSVYQNHKEESLIISGEKFETNKFNAERERITSLFRNNGFYHFEQEYISFDADTISTNNKANIELVIANREIKKEDSTYTVPYRKHYISDVNVFTDYNYTNKNKSVTDSANYKKYTLYSFDKLKYKPKAVVDAIFIKKGEVYKDRDRSLTYKRMQQLGIFKYPDIQYMPDPRDSTGTQLISNIFLTPKEKFGVDFNFDVSRSNIQDFGIGFGGSLLIRNIFRGAETLEIGGRGSVGSSRDAAKSEDNFFNISEIGADVKLSFPKIAFPINTSGIIPKYMFPFTTISAGISTQQNIGLDKRNLTGKFNYRWYPNEELTHKLDLIDLQYVRNLNRGNYFNVYRNSYNRLNTIAQDNFNQIDPTYFYEDASISDDNLPNLKIPEGTQAFINEVNNNNYNLSSEENRITRNIIERRDRLTQNNLILASNFSYIKNTRENIYDQEFTQFRFRVEAAGNSLYLLASLSNLNKNSNGNYNVSNVEFSQYGKVETDFIKHWDLGQQNIFAIRALGGVAIPYLNSKDIPFARSFFAGGANDNRGWQAYDLGPGSSGGINEFNEANMKITLNAEYRFNLFGQLNSALFIDAGNIWNTLDNVEDERMTFTKFSDLKKIAVSSGVGLRYDLSFFVIRLDLGFKTYNPAFDKQKWFQQYNFSNAVYNVGINYPF